MRPYMLWLTRVYAGHGGGRGTMFLSWPNVIGDWARRLREHDCERAIYPRPEPGPTLVELSRDHRTSTSTENRHRAAVRRARARRARGAVQGGR